METSGAPFKIHVSGSTADLIQAAGKGYVVIILPSHFFAITSPFELCLKICNKSHWLDARKEQIVAKGKGVMQTYWCEPNAVPSFIDDSSANDLDSYQGDEGR